MDNDSKLKIADEMYGPLLPYIKDDDVTDINYNGEGVWIDDLNNGRYKVDVDIDQKFVTQFSTKLSNLMNEQFNKYTPFLEAETDTLRVSFIHPSVTNTGYSVSIRKTPPKRRITLEKIKEDNYCAEGLEAFLSNAIKAEMNVIICGLPGTGKTEFLKYLTTFIPPWEKVMTIEDNLEIRYREINPGKDCVEMKVGSTLSYDRAIKLCLRQLPTWVLLSEARSVEVEELIKSMITGTHCITTLHTDDVRKVADRMRNMSKAVNVNDVYNCIDIAIQIKSDVNNSGKIKRRISQVGFLVHDIITDENKTVMFYEEGNFVTNNLPEDILRKFKMAGIKDPFKRTFEDYELNVINPKQDKEK